ncbi:MAG: hypothetical protein AABN33_02625 [Acidobacteriota bacterium]
MADRGRHVCARDLPNAADAYTHDAADAYTLAAAAVEDERGGALE